MRFEERKLQSTKQNHGQVFVLLGDFRPVGKDQDGRRFIEIEESLAVKSTVTRCVDGHWVIEAISCPSCVQDQFHSPVYHERTRRVGIYYYALLRKGLRLPFRVIVTVFPGKPLGKLEHETASIRLYILQCCLQEFISS